MSEDYQIWWIDDEDSNVVAATELGNSRSDLDVEFQTPNKVDDFKTEPDLILVDWFLDQGTPSNYERGISIEAKLREKTNSETPIYGFSGESEKRLDEQFSDKRFDHGIFERADLSEPEAADKLVKDIKSYEAIRDVSGGDFRDLVDLLAFPEDDYDSLESIIPREYSDGLPQIRERPGAGLNFARWVRTRFLVTPGPLLNPTWAATQLGLAPEAFSTYCEEFTSVEVPDDLKYSGVFSHRVDDRYWESQLMRALAKLEQDADVEGSPKETWQVGFAVLGACEDERATCAVCEEPFPQTVAAKRRGENAQLPVHYRHSNVHHSREGAFKDYREISRGNE